MIVCGRVGTSPPEAVYQSRSILLSAECAIHAASSNHQPIFDTVVDA